MALELKWKTFNVVVDDKENERTMYFADQLIPNGAFPQITDNTSHNYFSNIPY